MSMAVKVIWQSAAVLGMNLLNQYVYSLMDVLLRGLPRQSVIVCEHAGSVLKQ